MRLKVGGGLSISGTNPLKGIRGRGGRAPHGLGGTAGWGRYTTGGQGVVRSTAWVVAVSGVENTDRHRPPIPCPLHCRTQVLRHQKGEPLVLELE